MLTSSIAKGLVIESVIIYKVIYITITLFSILIAYIARKVTFRRLSQKQAQALWMLVVSLLVAVFAAIRPLDIPDTKAYQAIFDKLYKPSAYISTFYRIGKRLYNMEMGFIFLFSILKEISQSFRFSLFCIAFINGLIFLWASVGIANLTLKQINFAESMALFFSFFAYHYCCIALRAGMSLSLGMLAVYLVLKRKSVLSLIVLCGAMLFHSMALLFLPYIGFTLIDRGKTGFPWTVLLCCSIVCICVLFFNLGTVIIKFFTNLFLYILTKANISGFSSYLLQDIGDQSGKRIWLAAIASIAVLFSVCRKGDVDRNMIIMVLIGMFITSFLYPITAISRASDYCYAFLLPIIASCRIEKLPTFGKAFMGYAIFPIFFLLQMTI